MSRAAKVWCAIAIAGLDVGIATRHWLTDGFDLSNGLVQGQVRGEVWWNARFVDIAREMNEALTSSVAFVAAGLVAAGLAAVASVLLAVACGYGGPRAQRCALLAMIAVIASAAAGAAFLYLYPLNHMTPSWSLGAFAAGVLATCAAAMTVRRPG